MLGRTHFILFSEMYLDVVEVPEIELSDDSTEEDTTMLSPFILDYNLDKTEQFQQTLQPILFWNGGIH